MRGLYHLLILALCSSFLACSSDENSRAGALDTPTSGSISVVTDETLKPLVTQLVREFESTYSNADIVDTYAPLQTVINQFLHDTVRSIVIPRDLTKEEKTVIEQQNLSVYSTAFAIDGIALILNPENKDTTIKWGDLVSILKGEISEWGELGPSELGNIQLVFDNSVSSTIEQLLNLTGTRADALNDKAMSKSVFAVDSNEAVINYVKNNPAALGVIGVNWISDKDDPEVQSLLNSSSTSSSTESKSNQLQERYSGGIKVAYLSNPPDKDISGYYRPYIYFLKEGKYPLSRMVYVIKKGGRSGLGSGFSSYVAGPQGQSIVRLSGLVPTRAPIQLVVDKK